jgi:2',3'-cyclic-nucleotide 2'-phosphodiesterase (5'-nucleotidase family)
MRPLARSLALVLLAFAAPSLVLAGSGAFTLFHTNDLHSRYLPASVGRDPNKTLLGGFAALDATFREERAKAKHSLYFDAGDFMTGTPLADIEYEGARGGAIVAFQDLLGLDAATLGNHEFDQSIANLDALLALARHPFLAANLHRPDGSLFTGKAYEIFDVGDVRVGVIGVTTDDLHSLVGKEKRTETAISPGADAIRALVPEVDAKSDLIVVLSHEGVEEDREIAGAVEGIDIIVGGHSHTRLATGETVNGVLILQAGSNGEYIGRADLVVEGDSLASADCRLVPVKAEGAVASPEVAALVDGFEKRIDAEFGAVIATAPAGLGRCYFCESDLGNWVTDRVREATGADVALVNSGGLRKDLQAGPVTKLDIFEVLPFWNQVCVFTCTGEDLFTIALTNARAETEETYGSLQVSGLSYSWWLSPEGLRIPSAQVGGLSVDPKKTYRVASIDFVAVSNADKYLGFVPKDIESLGITLTSLVTSATERLGVVEAPREDRIQRVEIDFKGPGRK